MLDKLQEMFVNIAGRSDIVLTMDTPIDENLGLSSFGVVQLVCAIEDEFDIEIPNKEIKNFKRIGDVVKFLETCN